MKKIVLISIVLAAALFVFSSCERENSSDVNQDRIFVIYEMVYHQSTDITYARASFFFGGVTGTKLELSDPNKIICNDKILSLKSALAYYEKEFEGFIDTANYKFTDADGNSFVNEVYIKEIGLSENPDTIIKGNSFTLNFNGEPLAQRESVYVCIDGLLENDKISVYQNTSGATSIIIPANQTSKLSVGTNTVYLRRKTEITPQETSSAGASCSGIYQTKEINIEVVE
ncbi:MAG: hypothetical protein RBR97_03495 [Bacteroidales bacterium]|nr:hypothetical protein [Bacteroidales bacterium]